MRKLCLGCGPYPKPGYINIDINPAQHPDVVRDVRKGLPYDDQSVDEVLAVHFLEHLTGPELLDLVEEVYRVLVPGGRFRIGVPLGNTGHLDHRSLFTEQSFDNLALEESPTYYARRFRWRMADKEPKPDDPPWETTTLWVTLESLSMTSARTGEEKASDSTSRETWNAVHTRRNSDALSDSDPEDVLRHHGLTGRIRPGLHVLDIGVGMGKMAKYLHSQDCIVDCVDVADAAQQFVIPPARAFYAAEHLESLPSDEYDLAISMLVAQHMCDRNLRDQVAQVYRALKRGGRFSLHLAGATSGALNNRSGPIPPGQDGAMCRNIDYLFALVKDVLPAGHAILIQDHLVHWPAFGSYWYFVHIVKES